ncbi:restriction endonuclease subunit S [Acidisoma sp. C75]
MSFEIVIPADWRRSSVSKFSHVQLGKMLQNDPSGDDDELLPYLRAISIAKSGLDLSHQFAMWIKPHEKEKFRLKRDDILISEGGDAGRTAQFTSDDEYYFQNAINRVRPLDGKQIASRYLFWWFTFLKLAGYVDLICNVATIPHFTAEKVKAAPFAFPSLEIQKRIAAFLDEKTAQIDGLIERKRELLERLAEKRQAIITQAVTKGLNPAAPMKDSGIDWLGQIPAHWEVRSLRYTAESLNRMRIPIAAELRKGIERVYPYYGASGIIDYVDEYIFDFPTVLVAEDGANLLSRSTPLAFRAAGKYWVNNHAHILRPTDLTIWFCAELLAIYPLDPYISGSAQPKLTKDNLMSLPVWIPPLEEQAVIEKAVIAGLHSIGPVIEKCGASMRRLSEYRSALITAAVTGQIEGLR